MIIKINKFNKSIKDTLRNTGGQAAIVLILIIAISVIFYAASLNLGKLSTIKTGVQVSATNGAAILASQMASYGQSLFKEQLGGDTDMPGNMPGHCESTGLIGKIVLLVIIIIILIIVAVFTMGAAAAAAGALAAGTLPTLAGAAALVAAAGAIVGTAAVLASTVISAAYIQPMITNMWNSIVAEILPIADQFIENGLRTGLLSIASDPVLVPDLFDLDNDRIWGWDDALQQPKDVISRLALYYNEVLKDIPANVIFPEIVEFQKDVENFVYKINPNYFTSDPGPSVQFPKSGASCPATCTEFPIGTCNCNVEPSEVRFPKFKGMNCPTTCADTNPGSPLGECVCTCTPGCNHVQECVKNPIFNYDFSTTPTTITPNNSPATCQTAWGLFDPIPEIKAEMPQDPKDPIPPDPNHRCHYDAVTDPGPVPSECNPCCVPETIPSQSDTNLTPTKVRPGKCDCITKNPRIDTDGDGVTDTDNPEFCGNDPASQVGVSAGSVCQDNSPYGTAFTPTLPKFLGTEQTFYSYIFNPFIENNENNNPFVADPRWFISFREALGTDDENPYYLKTPNNPDWAMQTTASNDPLSLGVQYVGNDTTWYYTPPEYTPSVGEEPIVTRRLGMFSLLHKLNDWGIDLGSLGAHVNERNDVRCRWCDDRVRGFSCNPKLPDGELGKLDLPIWPIPPFDPSGCVDPYIDNVFRPGANAPAAPGGSISIIEDEDENDPGYCTQQWMDDPSTLNTLDFPDNRGFWKPGADRFCKLGETITSSVGGSWPYNIQCRKHKEGGCRAWEILNPNATAAEKATSPQIDCSCTSQSANPSYSTDPANWKEDFLDDLIYGLTVPGIPDFVLLANHLIGTSPKTITTYFSDWFDKWERFINPSTLDAADLGINCYANWDDPSTPHNHTLACPPISGALINWYKNIREINGRLQRYANYEFARGTVPGQFWCSTRPNPPFATAAEVNAGADSTKFGQFDDIIACLNYNIDGPGGIGGNHMQFGNCAQNCSAAACSSLPTRSLVSSTFNPSSHVFTADRFGVAPGDIVNLLNCYHSCNTSNCEVGTSLPASALYSYPGPVGSSVNDDIGGDCDSWGPSNPWYDSIVNNLITANTSCDLRPGQWLKQIDDSWYAAENQVSKMIVRRRFLQNLYNDLLAAVNLFSNAEVQFRNFLHDDVGPIIELRRNYVEEDKSRWPLQTVYGWAQRNKKTDEQLWHIVRADARIPKRCKLKGSTGPSSCGVGGAVDPVDWPKVLTEASATVRCFYLDYMEGIVKYKITRYDQSSQIQANRLVFPNGVPIWKFKFSAKAVAPPDASGLFNACMQNMMAPGAPYDADPHFRTVWEGDVEHGLGAFIMTKMKDDPATPDGVTCTSRDPNTCNFKICPEDDYTSPECRTVNVGRGPLVENKECWLLATKILAMGGISSSVCAHYYYKDGLNDLKGFTFSFIPCPGNQDF